MIFNHFDRPLSAGASAELHFGSLVMEFTRTASQLAELERQLGDWDRASDSEVASGQAVTFGEMTNESKQFLALCAHEQDHLNRLMGTTYGLLCDDLHARWISACAQLIREYADRGNEKLFPLIRTAPVNHSSFEESLRTITDQSASLTPTLALVNGLTDCFRALTDDISSPEFASALWGLTNGRSELVPSLLPGVDVTSKNCAAFPTRSETGAYHPLTARHLLELFALRQQGNKLVHLESGFHELDRLLNEGQHEYSTAHLSWLAVFPDYDKSFVDSLGRGEGEMLIDWKRMFPFELFVAADLALWPPFLPDRGIPLGGSVTWPNLNPGRRFGKILSAMKALGIVPSRDRPEDMNRRFCEIQADVCRALGWPTPELLAEIWLDHFDVSPPETLWNAMDGPPGYRLENAKILLRARLERPSDLVLNNVDVQSLGVESSPGLLCPLSPGRLRLKPTSRSGYDALNAFLVIEGVKDLCEPCRLFLSGQFDQTLRKVAFEVLANHLARAADWDAALLERFRCEAKAYFRL